MMTGICKKHLFLASLFNSLLQCTLAQNCPRVLANIAVSAGNSTWFPSGNNGHPPVKWQVAPSSVTFSSLRDITDYDDAVATEFQTTYAVNSSQLTIFKATIATEGTMPYATAGLYIVNYREPECMFAAGLVVVDGGPICTCDATSLTNVRLECSVNFASYPRQLIRPIMTWKINGGAVLKTEEPQPTSLDLDNQGLQNSVSWYYFAAIDSAPPAYECQLTFSTPSPEQPEFIAANAPDFKASCFIANCALKTTTVKDFVTAASPAVVMTLPSVPAAMTPITAAALNCSAQALLNTVAYEGSVAWFPRADISPLAVKWLAAPASSSVNSLMDITNYDDRVTAMFTTSYAANSSQLTILKATVASAPDGSTPYSTAGLYAVDYQNRNCMKAAGLVVISNGPTCSCDASVRSSVKLGCSVVFANYINQRINPIMAWINSSGTVARVSPQPISLDRNNPGLQSSVSQLPVASTDATLYECRLTFSAPTANQPEFVAANAPIFTASCFIANCAVRTTTGPFTSAFTKTQGPPSTLAPQTNSSSTSFESTAVSNHPSTSSEITASSIAQTVITATTSIVSTTLSNSTTTPLVPATLPNSTTTPLVSTTLSNFTSSDAVLFTSNSSVTNSISSLNESTKPSDQVSQSSTIQPSSPAPSLAMSGNESETQARAILLSLVFGSLLSTAIVIVCWYFCCCPYPPKGKTGTKGRIQFRRNILQTQRKERATLNTQPKKQATLNTQPKEQATLNTQPKEQATLNTQPREQATLDTQPKEQATLNTQPKEQATLNTQPREQATLHTQPKEQATLNMQTREQATLHTQRSEETPDNLHFEVASNVQF